ncbi:hypothetical protein [Flagellimonas aurea]|uniref:hypothetical protein n=1 Tax=Flagellimonas aurea TaxID=2915619 RepID=UPI0035CEA055
MAVYLNSKQPSLEKKPERIKIKENLIGRKCGSTNPNQNLYMTSPELTDAELEKFKIDIQKKKKRERKVELIFIVVVLFLIILAIWKLNN